MDGFFDVPPDDALRLSSVEVTQRRLVESIGLTELEAYVLSACYSTGHSAGEVAAVLGVGRDVVQGALQRACDKTIARGLPTPRAYGRGSRAELLAAVPQLIALT